MTRTGKRGRVGHLRSYRNRDRLFCGREGGEELTDADRKPLICKTCAAAFERVHRVDHHHVTYRDGRWVVNVPQHRYVSAGNGLNVVSMSSTCGIDGCARMVKHELIPYTTITFGSTTPAYWINSNSPYGWWAA